VLKQRGKVVQETGGKSGEESGMTEAGSNTSMQRRPRSEFLIIEPVSHAAPLMRSVSCLKLLRV
jgi:hypothetical protein